ncbi:uncharacterized protein LOC108605715 [Drosophila busckii]|uniref:uncharacterized protein LOC108605715 n=1 Tax=Drosophila busckii TaxID=30019 RepID=UPI00083F1A2B|nr:uncharacterized protein LOC108605715 [Drosophila busckii]
MHNNIWNSSQMAGNGGALKALTKNLANQLNFNRAEMKRVVARVISERHGEGEVGDYNGHMFYVKPERVDMTKQITQSKEAFDELMHQKQQRLLGAPNSKASGGGGGGVDKKQAAGIRAFTYNLSTQKNARKSLNGVIIDQQQLEMRANPHEILVQISNPKLARPKLRKPKPLPELQIKLPLKPQKATKQAKSNVKLQQAASSKPSKLLCQKKSRVKQHAAPAAKPKQKRARVQLPAKSSYKRLPAGQSKLPAKRQPNKLQLKPQQKQKQKHKRQFKLQSSKLRAAKKPSALLKKRSSKQLQQPMPTPTPMLTPVLAAVSSVTSRNYDKPWLVKPRRKRQRAGGLNTPKRLRAGGLSTPKLWRNPYQFPGGAGATQPRHNKQQQQQLQPKRKKSLRRLLNKRSQARFVRDLKRDEAIDDPERLEAGRQRKLSKPSKRLISAKLSPRMEQLARPVRHRSVSPSRHSLRAGGGGGKQKLRRSRRPVVVVGSSLGSIAPVARTSSQSALTPAKRNLALAFLNKDTARHGVRNRRSSPVMWR